MMKIRFRPRSFLGPIAWLVSATLIGIIIFFVIQLIRNSLDPSNPLQAYLNNNLIVSFFAAAIWFIVGGLLSFPKKNTLFAPIMNDDRAVMNWEQLERNFRVDASCNRLKEWGWQMRGEGTESKSEITYKTDISGLVTITAQFKGSCPRPENKYWRTGIIFSDSLGKEHLCVHIDNHNLLVAYVHQQVVLKVTVPFILEDRFVTISCQLSESSVPGQLRAFCQINNTSYCLGNVQPTSWPWTLYLRGWSDNQKYHIVSVRDISISKVLA
jgi:hypothetical protein